MKEVLSRGKIVIPSIHPLFKKSSAPIRGTWITNRNATRKTYSIFDTDK